MTNPAEKRLALGFFIVCVALNLVLSSAGWGHSLRERHEFRQVQTALSAHYLQRDGWQLAYPLPLFGPPWSAPFEFPLYQLATAWFSSLTGLHLEQAGRAVSLLCLYLALPAFYLLQEFLPIPASRRWLLLGLILVSPLYLYFSRSFMIESLALCAAAWFLLTFMRAMTRPGSTWPLAAVLLGVVAALAKSTTLAIFLVAAGLFTLAYLRRLTRMRQLATLARALGLVAPALVATFAWMHYSDAVKASNPLSQPLVSLELREFMTGTINQRLDPAFWSKIAGYTSPGIINSANAAFVVLFGLILARSNRGWVGALLLCFATGPLVFANVYVVHDYYSYATGVFALAALALAWSNLLDLTAYPLAARYAAIAFSLALQLGGYAASYWPTQHDPTEAPPELAAILRQTTGPRDIVLILGQDWNPLLAYYADRRAIMVREALVAQPARLEEVLQRLGADRITALVITGGLRDYPDFISTLTHRLNLFPRPAVFSADTQLYLNAALTGQTRANLEELPLKSFAPADQDSDETIIPRQRFPVAHLPDKRAVSMMHPQPEEIIHPFGVATHELEGRTVLNAHVPTDVVFQMPAGAREITVEFGILPGAWQNNKQPTAGVEFRVEAQPGAAPRKILFERGLHPVQNPDDRGVQSATFAVPAGTAGKLLFRTLPGPTGSIASGWAYWAKIDIH